LIFNVRRLSVVLAQVKPGLKLSLKDIHIDIDIDIHNVNDIYTDNDIHIHIELLIH